MTEDTKLSAADLRQHRKNVDDLLSAHQKQDWKTAKPRVKAEAISTVTSPVAKAPFMFDLDYLAERAGTIFDIRESLFRSALDEVIGAEEKKQIIHGIAALRGRSLKLYLGESREDVLLVTDHVDEDVLLVAASRLLRDLFVLDDGDEVVIRGDVVLERLVDLVCKLRGYKNTVSARTILLAGECWPNADSKPLLEVGTPRVHDDRR